MTIVEFLLARLAEDETVHDELHNGYYCASTGSLPFPCDCGVPQRMLAEVKAKRQIIETHSPISEWCGWTNDMSSHGNDPCDTLQALAAIYEDHPDYDNRWAVA